MRLCRVCFKNYKRSRQGKKDRKLGLFWKKGDWPEHIYHDGKGRFCPKHLILANFNSSNRRAFKLKATPKWANKKAILEIYKKAKEIEKTTGVKQHVDHIVPLRGENVCGLHVENNLQVLSFHENAKKNNKWPYKGYE